MPPPKWIDEAIYQNRIENACAEFASEYALNPWEISAFEDVCIDNLNSNLNEIVESTQKMEATMTERIKNQADFRKLMIDSRLNEEISEINKRYEELIDTREKDVEQAITKANFIKKLEDKKAVQLINTLNTILKQDTEDVLNTEIKSVLVKKKELPIQMQNFANELSKVQDIKGLDFLQDMLTTQDLDFISLPPLGIIIDAKRKVLEKLQKKE